MQLRIDEKTKLETIWEESQNDIKIAKENMNYDRTQAIKNYHELKKKRKPKESMLYFLDYIGGIKYNGKENDIF